MMKSLLVLVVVLVLTGLGLAAYGQKTPVNFQCWETDTYRLKDSGIAMSQLILFTSGSTPLTSVLIGRHSLSSEPERHPGTVVEIQYLGTDDAGATFALRQNLAPTNAQRVEWSRRIKLTAPATATVDLHRYAEIAGLPYYFLENSPAENFRIPRPSVPIRVALPTTRALGFPFLVDVLGPSALILLQAVGGEPWQRCR